MSLSQHLPPSLCIVQPGLQPSFEAPAFLSHDAGVFASAFWVVWVVGVVAGFVSLALSWAMALVDKNAAIASIPTNNVTFFIDRSVL